jgi:RES domain-containing protein
LIVVAWRIVKRRLARTAFDGEGARRFGGRWNSKGVAVVYLAQSQSLAALEILVHIDSPQLLEHYVAVPVSIDSDLIARIDLSTLPKNWKSYPPPKKIRSIGDDWVGAASSAVLQVPSVIVPLENNFLLNPRHPDFPRLQIGKPVPFKSDSRLTSEL